MPDAAAKFWNLHLTSSVKHMPSVTIGMEITKSEYSSDRPAGFFVIADSEQELKEKIVFVDQNIQVLNENNEDIMLHGLYD